MDSKVVSLDITSSYIIKGFPEIEDKTLADIIDKALGLPLIAFTRNVVSLVQQETKCEIGTNLHVRCYFTDKLGMGNYLRFLCPMIALGFTGDVKDFTITMIHELLHAFNWDEKIIEAKAQELYKKEKK